MLVVAYAFSNAAAFFFVFFLTAFGFNIMLLTHQQLEDLSVDHVHVPDTFPGEPLTVKLHLRFPALPWRGVLHVSFVFRRKAFDWLWRRGTPPLMRVTDIHRPLELAMHAPGVRGRHEIPRITVVNFAPARLLRAWRYFSSHGFYFVYPNPVDHGCSRGGGEATGAHVQRSGDEFAGHKPFRYGEKLTRVDWKAVARGRPMLLKDFGSVRDGDIEIRWMDTEMLSTTEQRLEQMSFWIREANERRASARIHMPDGSWLSDHQRALRSLSTWGLS